MKKVISGYYKINGELVKVTTSEIIQGSQDIQDLENRIAEIEYGKQDNIEDLTEIRDNAAAGAALSSSVSSNTVKINSNTNNINSNTSRISALETENEELKNTIEEIKAGGVASSIYIKDWSE